MGEVEIGDRLVKQLEFINDLKNMNTWNVILNCIHLSPGDEIVVEFMETDWLLCEGCIARLYSFLIYLDDLK